LRRLARATDGAPAGERVWAFAYLPVLRFVGDVAKMIGYPVGVWWRIRREWIDG
jgi:hypothetical protein